ASISRPASYGQVFNVGADKPYSVLDLAKTVSKVMGVKPNIKHLDARNEVVHAYSSHEKLQKLFRDLIRNVPLEEGVAKMAAWAKRVGAREGKAFTAIEVRKNLPRSWAALATQSIESPA